MEQRFGLGSGKEPILAGGQRAKSERAKRHADKPNDLITETLEHQPDLALHSLMEHDAQAPGAQEMEGVEGGRSPLDAASAKKGADASYIQGTIAIHLVDLRNFVPRVGQPLDQETIAREQQEPFAISVEAADVAEIAPTRGKKVINGLASPGIGRRAEESSRLVEKNGKEGRWTYRTTVERNHIPFLDLKGESTLNRTIDGHPSAENELFYSPSGSEATAG